MSTSGKESLYPRQYMRLRYRNSDVRFNIQNHLSTVDKDLSPQVLRHLEQALEGVELSIPTEHKENTND
jgi:hypothetical protein